MLYLKIKKTKSHKIKPISTQINSKMKITKTILMKLELVSYMKYTQSNINTKVKSYYLN